MLTPHDGHWHRRGTPEKAKTPTWAGWRRCRCLEPGCDWAIYVNPDGRERVGYIPSTDHPGDDANPADVTFAAKDRRLVSTARRKHPQPEPIGPATF